MVDEVADVEVEVEAAAGVDVVDEAVVAAVMVAGAVDTGTTETRSGPPPEPVCPLRSVPHSRPVITIKKPVAQARQPRLVHPHWYIHYRSFLALFMM